MKSPGLVPKAILLILIFSGSFLVTNAQIFTTNEMPRALYYDRLPRVRKFKDMKNMRDVLNSDKFLLGDNIFSGNISMNMGRVLVDKGTGTGSDKYTEEFRYSIGYFLRTLIVEEFSINTTFYSNLNPNAVQRWTPDFTYSFGRYNWRPNKVNYGYENYEFNKYSDKPSELWQKFLQGYYFIAYSHKLPDKWNKKIRIDKTTGFKFTYFGRYSMYYRDENELLHGGIFLGKTILGAASRFTIFKNIYIEGVAYHYPMEDIHKQPWDPDFSYGFGYFDYRAFRMSITYGNWVINRFPWNEKEYAHYGFFDGNFRIVFNYNW